MQGLHTLHPRRKTEEERRLLWGYFHQIVKKFIAFIYNWCKINLTICLQLVYLTVTVQTVLIWTNKQNQGTLFWRVSSDKGEGKDCFKARMVAPSQPHDLHSFCKAASFPHLWTSLFWTISIFSRVLGCSRSSRLALKGCP